MTKNIKISTITALSIACLMLAGCNTTGKRALTWGAVGAGVGAGTAAVTGGSVQKGAIIGGGAGAAAGAITR